MLGLLNEPSFIENIGDRGVRTLDDAVAYLRNGPLASYARHGHGLWLVTRREDGAPIGICGLLKRDALDDVDLGYALKPAYWGRGYALEAARAAMEWGRGTLGLSRIVAIVQPANAPSIAVLEKLGLRFETMVQLAADDVELKLFSWN